MKKKSNSLTIYDMCAIAIFAAVICVLAQIAIPTPTGVPFTLQTFAVTLTAIVLGAKKGTIAVLIYLLLGAVGVPVFANLRGGLQAIVSPTGGFLLSFPISAFLIGLGTEKQKSKYTYLIFLILGTVTNYAVGLVFYCIHTDSAPLAGFFACVAPFLPSGIILAVLATILGVKIRKHLLPLLIQA